MQPNDPIDILAIASKRLHYFDHMLHVVMQMNHSEYAQQQFDSYWVERRVAQDDMDALQTLIRELAKRQH